MADDGAPDPVQMLRQEEDRLRDVGQRLLAPPDEVEDLLKLLKEVEQCLLKVDQSLLESTPNAIRPATEALVKKQLMGHPDPDVRLGVASCISEITRITAPDAPYDDDAMRDVFYLIVSSFQHLDDIKDPFFERRVSILDTVAKVRACVVMLDLECDDLINDMFHHFLRTVSSGHSDAVISCMETIMRLVIEESDDVQPQIALCLLQNVRKEEKESSSPSFELAEKVIGSCREKLKPVFLQSLNGTSLSEYSLIVASVCEEGSDDREYNIVDPSGKEMPADIIPVKPRRGRPPGLKSLEKKTAGKDKPSGLNLKKAEEASDSTRKLKKAGEGESSKKLQVSSLKQKKNKKLSEEDPVKDLSLKEMMSPKSSTREACRTKGQNTENSTSKRKQEQEDEELPRSRKSRGLDGSLVGTRIKVWWPDCKKFYKGVVEYFDSGSKKHKVAYDDGDVEVLLLRNEKWEFISEEKQASVASETTPRRHKDKRLPSFHPLDLICKAIGRSPQDASVGARAHHVASIGEQQNNMDSLQKMVDFGRESLNCEGEQDVHDESLNVSANDADQQAQTSDEHITKGPMTTSTGGIVKKHKAIAEMPCIKDTGSVRPESRSAKANLNKQEADQGKDYSISRCLDVLEAMDDVPDEMKILASDVFRDATNRELFLCYASRLRGPWLKKELEKLHGP